MAVRESLAQRAGFPSTGRLRPAGRVSRHFCGNARGLSWFSPAHVRGKPYQTDCVSGHGASAPRRKSGVRRREALPTGVYQIKRGPTDKSVGNTLSNMYLSGHAPDKYTPTRQFCRSKTAKPARRPELYCREKPSEAVFRQLKACRNAGFLIAYLFVIVPGFSR